MATDNISLAPVTQETWRAARRLAVRPDQPRFVAEYAPVVAVALAKAYLRLGDLTWAPYAISAGAEMVGFVALAYEPASADDYWVFHFFIDQRYQGRGYARAALERLLALVKRAHPANQTMQLVVHPENHVAQHLYTSAGFRPTGAERWGEPPSQLVLPDPL